MDAPPSASLRAPLGHRIAARARDDARVAPIAAGGVLLVVYLATLAPGLTFWDAGEFIAAVHTFGIPHPPGTPLYILIARSWAELLPGLGTAQAVNLLSAVATAAACTMGAAMLATALPAVPGGADASRLTRDGAAGAAMAAGAALTAGAMSTVWLNATESEVYALSLLLSAAMLCAGERAGRHGAIGWVVLTGYLLVLCSPLHLGALVAAPAAIVLAARHPEAGWRVDRVLALCACAFAAAAASLGSWTIAAASAGALVGVATRPGEGARERRRLAGASVLVIGIALSAQLVMLVRAAHDPAINQGYPATLDALIAVVTREQYAVAGLWPRQAPAWLQVANLLEYVDWQIALGLAPGVAPSPWRTPFTILFIALGVRGAQVHRGADRRTWMGMAVLLLSATVGVLVQLNLKAGPSIGYGILPDDAPHEPRERDYFFALGFWAWGLWAGIGAVAAMRAAGQRLRVGAPVSLAAGLALAALPVVLNWRAVDRSVAPDATLARTFAIGVLESAPRDAVLFTWGDNDTYPLWYAREVERLRPDIVLVTVPLLPADWYRAELARRTDVLRREFTVAWHGQEPTLRGIAAAARAAGRPVATVITMPPSARQPLGASWTLRGLTFMAEGGAADSVARIDTAAARVSAARLRALTSGPPARPSTDVTVRYIRSVIECPRAALAAGSAEEAANSLAPVCNLR